MSVLTTEQVNQFLDRGYVTMPGCFSRDMARGYADQVFTRLGYDPADPGTWRERWVPMPSLNYFDVPEFAPRAWAAICEIMGGADRIVTPYRWSDGFIANLGVGDDEEWEPPSAKAHGWHIDGDFFRHFLDSPEQALLTLVIWSDIDTRGGGTFLAADSVPVVTRYLAGHPEGVVPREIPFQELVKQCHDFVEFTGKIGDVVLLHPFILHASSQNHSGRLRLMVNPPVHLREPMQFDRPDGSYSLVERAVLKALGADRYPFAPTAPRERIIPERERIQREAAKRERERLASVAG